MDIIQESIEFLRVLLTVWVYGSDKRPRHVIIRGTLRVIAFGGAVVVAAFLSGMFPDISVPRGIAALWGFCFLIVFGAEYEAGIPWLSGLAGAIAIGLTAWALMLH